MTEDSMHGALPVADDDPEADTQFRLPAPVQDRPLGKILKGLLGLTDEQIGNIVRHQQQQGLRFGEAAIALDYATKEDVLWALSQQFHYHYSPGNSPSISAELIVATDPFSEEAEKFREIRSQLMLRAGQASSRQIIAVTSLDDGDGKTYFAANLAVSFSQLGARTLLIDANMRHPRQHEVFGISSDTGLSAALRSGRLESEHVIGAQHLPNLFLLTVGTVPPNPLELLQRRELGHLLALVQDRFDHVVIDTPAAKSGADCKVIAAAATNCIIVARLGSTRTSELRSLISSFERTSQTALSVIINSI